MADADTYLCFLALTSSPSVNLTAPVTDLANGHYEFAFAPTQTGTYSLTLSLLGGGVAYQNSVVVGNSAFSLTQSALVAPLPTAASATSTVSFGITLADSYSNPYVGTDITPIITATPASGSSSTLGSVAATSTPGLVTASFVAAAGGSVAVSVTEKRSTQAALRNGLKPPQIGSFTLLVAAGPAVASTSYVASGAGYGTGTLTAKAEAATSFTVNLQDFFGNSVNASAPTVSFSLALRAGPTITLAANNFWTVAYTPGATGTLTIHVQTGGADISGSPFSLAVATADPPTVTSAVMTDDAAGALVTFSSATDGAGMGAATDCSLVLDAATLAKVGSGASCTWLPLTSGGSSQLAIRFGSGPTILPVVSALPLAPPLSPPPSATFSEKSCSHA